MKNYIRNKMKFFARENFYRKKLLKKKYTDNCVDNKESGQQTLNMRDQVSLKTFFLYVE